MLEATAQVIDSAAQLQNVKPSSPQGLTRWPQSEQWASCQKAIEGGQLVRKIDEHDVAFAELVAVNVAAKVAGMLAEDLPSIRRKLDEVTRLLERHSREGGREDAS